MSYVCQNCGKSTVVGRSKTHKRGVAGKRWRKRAQATSRTFKPNLQKYQGRLLCTKCIKKLKVKSQKLKLE